nr:PepSY-associated TM helix domain-containing protein [Rhodopseudomonas palustris]
MFQPILVNARDGRLERLLSMPWYLRLPELSKPLHFGDYGGLPLKIVWAALDVIAIIVLGTGVYLWLVRRPQLRANAGRSAALIGEPWE